MAKLINLVILLAATTIWLASCRTMEGFGKDIQSAGESIQGAAN